MALISSLSWVGIVLCVVFSIAFYLLGLVAYRLFLSPIAAFPGPLLPRITFWYEFYYDWIHTGQYYLKINEMHKKYGPIVRVTPDELHISDPSYYNKLFVSRAVRRTNGYLRFARGTGFEDMAAVSEKDELHRITRVPLDPFFSKVGIVRVEPRVLQRVKKLCGRFDALADTGKPVNITHAVGSLANDVISSILFEEPSDYLGDEDFNASWFEILKKGTMTVPLLAHLPWLARVMAMPAVRAATERVTNWRIWDDRIRRQLVATRLRPGDEAKTRDGTTFFDHLVHSDLVEAHFGNGGFTRLAQLMQQAGSHNIAHTTGTIIAYLCMDKEKEECLRKVLVPLFDTDNPDKSPTSKELEKVPYLQACILEGFRMAIGAMLRAPRISPDTDLEFQKWIIPKGTPVAMSSYWMHMDATVFPNPEVFIPERWLSNNPEKLKLMHNYSVPFSKGSRACLGQNLVRLQMSLSLAHIYRPGAPRIKLYNTMKSDFVAKHGLLYPWQNLESQGVCGVLSTAATEKSEM